MVVADVTRAHANVQSAALRVVQADRALRTAIITFNGNYEGLQQTTRFGDVLVLVYRPQEAVYALELLNLAFDEYFTTVAEYNRGGVRALPRAGLPRRRGRAPAPARRRHRCGHGAAARICPRWATDRPRPPADADRPDTVCYSGPLGAGATWTGARRGG